MACTLAGFTRGQLQQLQDQVAKLAAMAALMCREAGWWQLEVLLQQLSSQALVGTKPELFELMKVRELMKVLVDASFAWLLRIQLPAN